MIGQDLQSEAALDGAALVPGDGEDLDVVIGIPAGPVRQNLPRACPVELLRAFEQGDPDRQVFAVAHG